MPGATFCLDLMWLPGRLFNFRGPTGGRLIDRMRLKEKSVKTVYK